MVNPKWCFNFYCWWIFRNVVLVALLVLGPVTSAQQTFALGSQAKTFASLWDSREQRIYTAVIEGETDLVVQPLPYIPGDIGPDPGYWINRCVATYYGLNSIVAR